MVKIIFFLLFIFFLMDVKAQSPEDLVNKFFTSMYNVDTSSISAIMIKSPALNTSSKNKNGELVISTESIENMKRSIAGFRSGELEEKIFNLKSDVSGSVATLTMDYEFFFKNKFSHCGIDVFHFLKDKNGWKITGIDDTREFQNCGYEQKRKADRFLDDWHMAATKADSMAYFTMLDERSIFIGTDSSEVWTKPQFAKFAGPYFRKGKAWDFKKVSRHLHFEGDKNIIWFDEMLTTWMGPCRGSGFINIKPDGQFKIMQYVLSVTVPNDKIQGVIDVIKK